MIKKSLIVTAQFTMSYLFAFVIIFYIDGDTDFFEHMAVFIATFPLLAMLVFSIVATYYTIKNKDHKFDAEKCKRALENANKIVHTSTNQKTNFCKRKDAKSTWDLD